MVLVLSLTSDTPFGIYVGAFLYLEKSHALLFTSDQIYGYGPSCGIALQILPCYLKHCNFTFI
jgi:hypothetical protein